MKQVTIDGKTYNLVPVDDEQVREDVLPEPNKRGVCITADCDMTDTTKSHNRDFNVYRCGDFAANQVAPSLRIFHALWQAKEHVDPEFVPDWHDNRQYKYVIYWRGLDKKWEGQALLISGLNVPAFSTAAKRDKAIAILNHWGVRP